MDHLKSLTKEDLDREFNSLPELVEFVSLKGPMDGIPNLIFDARLLKRGVVEIINSGPENSWLKKWEWNGFHRDFLEYLKVLSGKDHFETLEEAKALISNPKFLTIRNLIGYREWVKEFIEGLRKQTDENKKILNSDALNNPEKALLLFLSGDKPEQTRGPIYNLFKQFEKEHIRLDFNSKGTPHQIRRYRKVIPLIPLGSARREKAEEELKSLESGYYQATGKKVE